MKHFIILFIICVFATSCQKHINTLNEFYMLEKGMPYESIENRIEAEPNENLIYFNDNGKEYTVVPYYMRTSMRVESESYQDYSSSGFGGRTIPQTRTRSKHVFWGSNYYLVFENDKLIYWGFLFEFKRNEDEFLNRLAARIVDENKKFDN